ncbi:MAG: isoleucine--tRNA ligase [Candidatus Acidiferrales bacterium]
MPRNSDLKNTLNLPRTAFPMKANLPQNEPKQLAEWEAAGLYDRIQKARAGAPTYVLHDGPPYPTGTIHLGTGLNKILKDMIVKSKTMAGFRAPYVPGWDCHGLPIETQVEKELGGKGKVTPGEFRRKCREFAERYVEQHRRDFKRLGIFGRWAQPYLTMNPDYEACIAGAFLTFLEKGYVYRGLKPVYWCIYDATALAEAEVEYEDHTSPSIWLRYKVVEASIPAAAKGNLYALVWTTTPWTLPASMALSFHPDFSYVVARDAKTGNSYLLAENLLASASRETGLELEVVGEAFRGKILEGAKFQHPFLDRVIPGILGKHVTLDQGSGIVHTAPGHGVEDFVAGQEYGIETYAPLDDNGRFVEGLAEYKGKTVFEANPLIVDLLERRGGLVHRSKLTHSYPHCWRCHNPVIFRATEQWFIGMDQPGRAADALRPRALAEIPAVRWTPEWGEERMRSMVAMRPDWCVSRQRFWGVPIIEFVCEKCGKRLEDVAALRNVVKWFEREGADAWFDHSAAELLPAGTRCTCGGENWRKQNDILDVWFDSGSSNLAVLGSEELPWPADLYLEGPDQFRGWFQSSLLVGVGVKGGAPYRRVLAHGWTLDEHGRPMSKSLGNVVLPSDVCEKWGADLLRLWVASQDYTADVRMSGNVMTQLSEAYRKLRNTFRFALGNLSDFDPVRDAVPDSELEEFDRYMLARTAELVERCRAWYESFEFHRVFHAVYDFASVDLSAFYFDILKDRLYTFAPRNRARRSAQTAVHRIASALLRLVAPILVFTAEEVWREFPRPSGASDRDSVHLAMFPSASELGAPLDPAIRANWDRLLEVRTEVLRALEASRNSKTISAGLEAKVHLVADGDLSPLLAKYSATLPALFLVSQVESDKPQGAAQSAIGVRVEKADGAKCERCWNYSIHVGENAAQPTICERCTAALAEIARDPARGTDGAAPGAAS